MNGIKAVAFDCYGTLVEFTDRQFKQCYHEICVQQSLPVEGIVLWQKWMEIWRRMAAQGRARENPRDWPAKSRPGPLSGPVLTFRPYREEWPAHFEACFQELNIEGDPLAAYEYVRDQLADAVTYSDAAGVVAALKENYRVGILSNADNDFLYPCLEKNALDFELVVTSESAAVYKPHEAIFRSFADRLGFGLDEVLYIGDSQFADVLGAKNAGMPVAWVNREDAALNQGMPEPDHVIMSLESLLDIFS